VELFFVRLLRGTGGEGLAGMKWRGPSPMDPNITLVRPLLDQPKSALAAYAKAARVKFREDATNAQLDIQRNRIRRELLPLLEKHYQPAIRRVVLRQMEITGAEAEFVTGAAEAWLAEKRRAPFDTLPLALQRRCLQLQLARLRVPTNFDLIKQLREFANRPVTVNDELAVKRDPAGKVTVQESGTQGFEGEAIRVKLRGGAGKIRFENVSITWVRHKVGNGTFRAPQRQVNQECFDAAKVGVDIVLRHWQPGDRFQPIGMGRAVKLQDLFTNEKISRAQRHRLVVGTTASGEVFWVEGLRLGEAFKLDKKSTYGLNWRWKRL
jgi:tRNA(Ile)-lysidine synthase